MAKDLKILIYTVTFMNIKIRALQKTNKALSKRRRAKKTRLRDQGSLTVSNAIDLIMIEKLIRKYSAICVQMVVAMVGVGEVQGGAVNVTTSGIIVALVNR